MIRKITFIKFMYLMMFISFLLRVIAPVIKFFKGKRPDNTRRILILEPFYPQNAGYEYRGRKWKILLEKQGFEFDIWNIMDENSFVRLTSQKDWINFHYKSVWQRFKQVWKSIGKYDVVIIRRALLPFNDYGDLFLDKFLLKLHDRVILDFDDDLSNNNTIHSERTIFGRLLWENRLIFHKSLSLHSRFIAGSHYLKELLLKHHPGLPDSNVIVIPTCVDYDLYEQKIYKQEAGKITFGWIGTNQNQRNLEMLIEPLNEIAKTNELKLLIISGKSYENEQAFFEIENMPWSLEREKEMLLNIDIGLMPVGHDLASKGKCGFKLIQYMGLGIVSAASAVTVNKDIIDDGINGFLVQRESDWLKVLQEILTRKTAFQELGYRAREKIKAAYSFEANLDKFISIL